MYIATHYVRVNGKMFTRGEEITEELSEDKIEWLTRAGAIKEVAPAISAKEPAKEPEAEEEPQQDAQEIETEEADEEAEAPEIDVMAGIVQSGAEEPEKRKTAAKKQAGRRKNG